MTDRFCNIICETELKDTFCNIIYETELSLSQFDSELEPFLFYLPKTHGDML
jgi:hypothetical protein